MFRITSYNVCYTKLLRKVLEHTRTEDASGMTRKATYKVVDYIESKEAKKIVAEIKNLRNNFV